MSELGALDPSKTFLLRVATSILGRTLLGTYGQSVELADLTLPIRKLTVRWILNSTGETGVSTTHWLNSTNGNIDDSWTSADFAAVESAWQTFWLAIRSHYAAGTVLEEFIWHHPSIEVHTDKPNSEIVGNPVRITSYNQAGFITPAPALLPPQAAISCTLKVPERRHWGRFYLPQPAVDVTYYTSQGQMTPAFTNLVGDALQSLVTSPYTAAGIYPVVLGVQSLTVRGVNGVQCDSIMDVIRRRRPHTPVTRNSHSVSFS